MKLVLDFETYYDKEFSLKVLQTDTYIFHDLFKIHGVAYKINDEPTVWKTTGLPRLPWDEITLVCQNAYFDCLVLSKLGIRPKFIRDTMSMNRALHGADSISSLAALAPLVGMTKGNELYQSEGVKKPSQELLHTLGEYSKNDVEITHALDNLFYPQMPENELRLIDLTVRMFTEPVLRFNKKRLEKHLINVIQSKREKMDKVRFILDYMDKSFIPFTEDEDYERIRAELVSDEKFGQVLIRILSDILNVDVKQDHQFLRELGIPYKVNKKGQLIPAFSKNDVEFKELEDHPNETVRDVIAARLAVKSALEETRTARFIEKSHRPWSPMYIYLGAHTHRWAGGNKENPQNLTRGSELRLAVEAPPGYVLVVCDSSQIEARINALLAGQMDLIEVFIQGKDPYVHMGRSIWPELSELSDKEFKSLHKDKRQIAKVVVLAAGYQMSGKKFKLYAKTSANLNFSQTEADEFIKIYRRANPYIVKQWWFFQEALQKMLEGETIEYGPITIMGNKILMPNGLFLFYPELSMDDKGFYCYRRKHNNKERVYLYGGILTENVVQSLARTVVAEQMLKISERYRIVMMTHDEVVACVPEQEAEQALKFMIECMNTPPSWWSLLPVASEGGWAKNYSK